MWIGGGKKKLMIAHTRDGESVGVEGGVCVCVWGIDGVWGWGRGVIRIE